jgi:S1-C subfamily serine protease
MAAIRHKKRAADEFISLPDLVAAVMPAVVYVEVVDTGSSGSGFAVSSFDAATKHTTLVTNAHAVQEGARHRVTLHDYLQHETEVRAIDESTDVAVLEIGMQMPIVLAFRSVKDAPSEVPNPCVFDAYGLRGVGRASDQPNRIARCGR